jgi:UDP-2,3-diacylglucosamine pyrophosphatase LpxH
MQDGPTVSATSSPPATARKGIFVSDLHVFSGRSKGESLPGELQGTYPESSLLVLGGDIFDFKWSSLGVAGTLLASEKWLHTLLDQWRGEVVFLAGNHDCLPKFFGVLSQISRRCDRFTWHSHHFHLGDAVFLHGDVLDAGHDLAKLDSYRDKFHPKSDQSVLSRRAYSAIVAMRIHRMAPKMRHRELQTCQRLLGLLPQLVKVPHKIRRVFFGHTHVAIAGRELNGVKFYNPGAAIRHIAFNPVQFDIHEL